jgi:hypothetical protein
MLINLVPEFLAALESPDPVGAYYDYLDRHRPVLQAYWHNYVVDLDSPHAKEVIEHTVGAARRDLHKLLKTTDVATIAGDALTQSLEVFQSDTTIDCYLMVGVGAANAGELVVGGRGVAFVCLEHFTGKANPETFGLGLPPELIPLWIAHEVAHAIRYTSPTSESELATVITEAGGYYDYWDTGTRVSLREHILNEGLAALAAEQVDPGRDPWQYFGYSRSQYRRLRELEAFLRQAVETDLDRRGLGLRLRYLSAGMSASARSLDGRIIPERAGCYLGARMAEAVVERDGIARALRASATYFERVDRAARDMLSA